MKKFVALHGAHVLGDVGWKWEEAAATTHSPKLLREVQEFSISYLLSETAIYERSVNYPFTILHGKRGVTHLQHTMMNTIFRVSRGSHCSVENLSGQYVHVLMGVYQRAYESPHFCHQSPSLTRLSRFRNYS